MEQGLNGMTGLKYEALKDFIGWNSSDDYALEDITRKHLPFLLSLGKTLAREINDNNRTN